jgi:hypothetical protein
VREQGSSWWRLVSADGWGPAGILQHCMAAGLARECEDCRCLTCARLMFSFRHRFGLAQRTCSCCAGKLAAMEPLCACR